MKLPSLKEFFFTPKALICLSALSILPVIASFCFLYAKEQKIGEMEEKVLFLQTKIEKKKQTRLQEERILSQIQKASPSYFQEQLSALSFLIPEQQKWKMCLAQLGSSLEVKEKYAFLENMDNRIEFSESALQKTPLFEERELSQQKPIRLNEEDLKKLLSSVEGASIGSYLPLEGSPQMVITSFSLKKNTFLEMQEEIYTVQMQLLTRQKASR
ncbi:MAG: hypothetical protein V4489_05915 [Chlamydiota bacterium]